MMATSFFVPALFLGLILLANGKSFLANSCMIMVNDIDVKLPFNQVVCITNYYFHGFRFFKLSRVKPSQE